MKTRLEDIAKKLFLAEAVIKNQFSIKELTKHLVKYGGHSKNCSRPRGPDCNCGWEELKKKLPKLSEDDSNG